MDGEKSPNEPVRRVCNTRAEFVVLPWFDSRLPRSSGRRTRKEFLRSLKMRMKGRCKHRQSHPDGRPAPLPRCPAGRSISSR